MLFYKNRVKMRFFFLLECGKNKLKKGFGIYYDFIKINIEICYNEKK